MTILAAGCSFEGGKGTAADAAVTDLALIDLPDPTDLDAPMPDGPIDGPPDAPPDMAPPPTIVTAGLIEDLDADVGASATAWVNQVSGGDDVALSAGTVTLVGNAVNGHAAMSFPGSARMSGDSTSAFASLVGGNGFTWFVVVQSGVQRMTGALDKNQVFGTIRTNGVNGGLTAGVDRASHPYAMARPQNMDNLAQSTVDISGTWAIFAGTLEAGSGARTVAVRVNGSAISAMTGATVPASPAPTGALAIGAEHTGGTEFWTGQVARILIYDRPLTALELSETGRALAARYAIATTF